MSTPSTWRGSVLFGVEAARRYWDQNNIGYGKCHHPRVGRCVPIPGTVAVGVGPMRGKGLPVFRDIVMSYSVTLLGPQQM